MEQLPRICLYSVKRLREMFISCNSQYRHVDELTGSQECLPSQKREELFTEVKADNYFKGKFG